MRGIQRRFGDLGSECGFVLIGWVDLDLIITRETVHEG
jgi:hypothetical protein